MRKIIVVLIFCMVGLQCLAFNSEIKMYKLSDGEQVIGRLCMPDDREFNSIVFVVHGTGQQNHLNSRKGLYNFNFYDELAKEFCTRGVAFFTYDRRGVTVDKDGKPPYYSKLDTLKYLKYTPLREAEDVEDMIASLKMDENLKDCNIILYGLSEGTIIAALVAERNRVKVNAIFMQGYDNENLFDIVKWQNQGYGIMILANQYFDKNGDKKINKEEYYLNDPMVSAYRKYLFQNMNFDSLDENLDGFITVDDIGAMRKDLHDSLLKAIKEDDNAWIRNNYMELTSNWFKAHFQLEPNKSRLLRLILPIYIFHGEEDANVPVEGVYDIEERFRILNKKNLTVYIFKGHNHDLNFEDWLVKKEWSAGMIKIFETAARIFK